MKIQSLMAPALLLIAGGPVGTAVPPALDAQGASALSSFLKQAVRRGDVPGVVVMVVARDGVLYHEAFGKMDVAQGVDMRKDAIFRIASMTKPITSVAAMMLVEEGRLGLDDDVSKYLPQFADLRVITRVDLAAGTYETRSATRPITIRRLLTHTSGIGYSWSDQVLALVEKLSGDVERTLVHEPGERWTYGAGPKVLGDVVAKLSGQPIEVFLENRIFRPLGMTDTGYAVPPAGQARVATLHQRKDGQLTEIPNPHTLAVQPRGDGRLFSTAADYCRFVQMILNRGQTRDTRLLKAETVREMVRSQTGDIKVRLQPTVNADYAKPFPLGAGEDGWGFGFQIASRAKWDPARRRPGSLSWAGINNTFFWIDPREEIAVIVLMQLLPFYDEAALGVLQGVETRVYQHLRSPGSY